MGRLHGMEGLFKGSKELDPHIKPRRSGFKMTELGPLPEDWEVVRLGEVFENMKQGKILPTSEILEYGAHPVYGANGIIGYYKESFVPKNKVLITCRGSTCGTVNFTVSDAFVTNNAMIIYEDVEKVYWLWLYYCLQEFSTEVLKTGSGQPQITKGRLLEFKIPLPPLPEQKAIARVLKTIQDAIEATEKVITAAKELKKSLMRHLFTYGPVPVSEKDRVRLKETEIGPIPEDWEVVRLGEVVEIFDKLRIPVKEEDRQKQKKIYPYCGANGIIDYVENYIFEGEFVLLAEDGGYWGPLENSSYIMRGKFWVNNHAHVLKGVDEKLDNYFLMHSLNFLDLRGYVGGDSRGKITQGRLIQILIPLPPLSVQQKIAQILKAVDDKSRPKRRKKRPFRPSLKPCSTI